jgi:hypothetical protein
MEPGPWPPDAWADEALARDRTRLVLCQYLVGTSEPRSGELCFYRQSDDPSETHNPAVVDGHYRYRLIEARTGDTVAAFELWGTRENAESTCPSSTGRATFRVAHQVPAKDLVAALRPFVEADLP